MNRQQRIEQYLKQAFKPDFLEVHNESSQHSVPANSQTHFQIIMSSDNFDNLSRIARHKAVYQLLDEELQNGLHALRLNLYSPAEWKARLGKTPTAPKCRGGSKHESS